MPMRLQQVERATERDLQSPRRRRALLEKPLIITGAASKWPACATLQLSELKSRLGSVKVPVRTTDDEFQAFFKPSVQEPGRRKMIRLADYVEAIERMNQGGERPPYAGNISILKDPAIAGKLASLVEQCRFPELDIPFGAMEYRLWIGAPGQRSTIHNDPYHNLNAQIVGRKRFICFAPSQHPALYPVFFHRAMWVSPIDPAVPDLARYPDFEQAQGFEAELHPGDILFLPRFWWHIVEAATAAVNINQWLYLDGPLQWWHEQPEARAFIDHERLLDEETRKFRSLNQELQAYAADDFAKLQADLLRFIESPR